MTLSPERLARAIQDAYPGLSWFDADAAAGVVAAYGASPDTGALPDGLRAELRCRDLPYAAHDWNSNGSPSFCRDCGIIFPKYAALAASTDSNPYTGSAAIQRTEKEE